MGIRLKIFPSIEKKFKHAERFNIPECDAERMPT